MLEVKDVGKVMTSSRFVSQVRSLKLRMRERFMNNDSSRMKVDIFTVNGKLIQHQGKVNHGRFRVIHHQNFVLKCLKGGEETS